jgi:hypothetical protein
MFKGEPLGPYSVVAQTLRVQEGLRERFRAQPLLYSITITVMIHGATAS